MIRLALIGTGPWGCRYVPSALEAGNCIITHVAGDPKGLRGTPYINNLRVVESREWRMLLDAPVDAFVVATPPSTHAEVAIGLLNAGRPVLIEKPMALRMLDALRISAAAKRGGAMVAVSHQHLFAPAYEELLNRISGSSWFSIASAGGSVGPHRSYSALWDYGPHDVSMFMGVGHWLGGDVQVQRASQDGNRYTVSLSRKHSVGTMRVWNDRGPKTRTFAVISESGMVAYNDVSNEKLWCNGEVITVSDEKPLARSLRAFADAVETGSTNDWRTQPALGLEVTRILQQADESLRYWPLDLTVWS